MSPNELKNSTAYQAVDSIIKKINGLSKSIEHDQLAYLEMSRYLISIIPESIPNDIVNSSLKSIENLITSCFVNNQIQLSKAISEQLYIDKIRNDEKELLEWLSKQPPQHLQNYKKQFQTVSQSQDQKELAQWILKTEIAPKLEQNLTTLFNQSLQQYNGNIKSILTDFAFIFSVPRVRDIEFDLQQIEQLKNTTEETFLKIEEKLQESKTLVTYIAKGTIDGHYALQTKKEESTANWWIGFSIFSTIAAIIWLGYVICNGITLCDNITMDKYKFLLYFIPRGSMTLCILGLATYFGQQAAYHRKNANFLRTRAFALQAISPFLDDIGKEKAESLLASKQKIVEHLLKDFDRF